MINCNYIVKKNRQCIVLQKLIDTVILSPVSYMHTYDTAIVLQYFIVQLLIALVDNFKCQFFSLAL